MQIWPGKINLSPTLPLVPYTKSYLLLVVPFPVAVVVLSHQLQPFVLPPVLAFAFQPSPFVLLVCVLSPLLLYLYQA